MASCLSSPDEPSQGEIDNHGFKIWNAEKGDKGKSRGRDNGKDGTIGLHRCLWGFFADPLTLKDVVLF